MSNIQKAFKNKAKLGLRMAAGGAIDTGSPIPTAVMGGSMGAMSSQSQPSSPPMLPNQGPAIFGSGGGSSPAAQPAPIGLSAGQVTNADMIGLGKLSATPGTGAGAAHNWLVGSTSDQSGGFYRAGGENDPKASAFMGANPKPLTQSSAAQNNPLAQVQGFDSAPSQGLQGLRSQPRRMAEGGILAVANTLRNRGAQIETAVNGSATQPSTQQTSVSAGSEADNYAAQADALERQSAAEASARQAAKKPKSFLSRLGLRASGVVQGEGTRTSDSVPASVGEGDEKQKLALSKGEGLLVVSNNTMDNPQAMDQIKQILAESNGGKEPSMPNQGLRRGLTRAANAAVIDPEELMADVSQRHGLANTPPSAQGNVPERVASPAPQFEPPRPTITPTMYGGAGLTQRPNSPATAYGNAQSAPVAQPTSFSPTISEADKAAARSASVGLAGRAADDRAWLAKNSDFAKTASERAPENWGANTNPEDLAGAELGARVLGPNAPVPQGLRAGRDSSGGMRLDFNSKNNVANDSMGPGNAWRQAAGEGVASMRQKDGSFKNVVLGASPTKWEDGAEYREAIARNEKDKITLRDMQHDRIRRTVAMPGATDGDRTAYAGQIKDDEIAATNAKNVNEAGYRNADLGLRRDQNRLAQENIQADNRRADAHLAATNTAAQVANAEKVKGHMDKLLDTYVPTAGLKDAELAEANGRRSRIGQAMLANFGGNMPTNLAAFEKDAPSMLHQARLTEALNDAQRNSGFVGGLRNVMNGYRRPTTSQDPMHPVTKQDGMSIEYGGVPLFANDVFHGDADLMSAYKQRLAAQAKKKSEVNN